ncbi:MAG: hypothetical protein ACLRP3_18770 [Escherichia sp.]
MLLLTTLTEPQERSLADNSRLAG